jgi:hypothetical protein
MNVASKEFCGREERICRHAKENWMIGFKRQKDMAIAKEAFGGWRWMR